MAQHNLGTVIGFEFFRTVKKARFWAATLAIPLVIAVVAGLVVLSEQTSSSTVDAQKDEPLAFAFTDDSGLVTDALAAGFGGTRSDDSEAAVAAVRDGTSEAYFAFPADPATQQVHVYGADRGLFANETYAAVARQILVTAAAQQIGSPQLTAVAQGDVAIIATAYRDGEVAGGITEAIAPMLFLVVLFLTIILLANQMIASTLEEKENRVTEMILTTLNPTTLIVGKVISVLGVGLIQMAVFFAPAVVGYVYFRDNLSLPDLDLSQLVLEPGPMIVAALLLLGGFVLFTGALVAIGAVMPTVKEAGNVFGPVIALMIIPVYTSGLIISDPSAPIVQVLTYFPFSAPVTAMLRNAFGSLGPVEAGIVITELFVLGFVALRLAVYLFRYGSIEYSKKLSLRAVLRRRDHT